MGMDMGMGVVGTRMALKTYPRRGSTVKTRQEKKTKEVFYESFYVKFFLHLQGGFASLLWRLVSKAYKRKCAEMLARQSLVLVVVAVVVVVVFTITYMVPLILQRMSTFLSIGLQ